MRKGFKSAVQIYGYFLFFLTIMFLFNCASREKIQKQTRFLMDTYVTIQIPGEIDRLAIIEKAFQRIEEIDRKFNVLDSTSQLFAFNQYNQPISDPEIIKLIQKAVNVSRETNGAFDVTIYPLIKLWGFFSETPALPKKKEILDRLPDVGYDQLIVSKGRIDKKNSHTQIDLGGIAKGYAVAEAVKVIRSSGVQSALIDAGGDIYAIGKIKGKPWKIAIRNPRGEGVIGTFDVSDLSVVTSGDYERFFEKDGVRYHHILDPKTGYPARGVASVTIITSDATLADALSTAVFVMGKDRGLNFLEKTELAEGVIVTDSGDIYSTKSLKRRNVHLK